METLINSRSMTILSHKEEVRDYIYDTPNKDLHKLCRVESNPLVDVLDIRKYKHGHTPTLHLVINEALTDSQIVSFLKNSAAEDDLTLRRGTAGLFFGYHIPKVKMMFGIPEGLESAVSKKLHGIVRDTHKARDMYHLISRHQVDLDFTTNRPIPYDENYFNHTAHQAWMEWSEQTVASVHRSEPNTITAWEANGYGIGVKVSITYVGPDSDSYYIYPTTTHDLKLQMHVNPDLTLKYSRELLSDTIPLGIVGIDDLCEKQINDRSQRVILRFLIQSRTERDGKPVPINFGCNKHEEKRLLDFITKNIGDILKSREKNGNSNWREISNYERLLMILQPNWILFHPKIQAAVVEAFNEYY